jgi:hypothetical protein
MLIHFWRTLAITCGLEGAPVAVVRNWIDARDRRVDRHVRRPVAAGRPWASERGSTRHRSTGM